MTPEQRYDKVTRAFLGKRGVTIEGKGFGSGALRVGGSIFAMLSSRREFVVKLPRDRVLQLVESNVGDYFDSGKGRPMKEWLAVKPGSTNKWEGLAGEAEDYVRSIAKKSPTRHPPPRKGEGNR